jgi:hypothetical protein
MYGSAGTPSGNPEESPQDQTGQSGSTGASGNGKKKDDKKVEEGEVVS